MLSLCRKLTGNKIEGLEKNDKIFQFTKKPGLPIYSLSIIDEDKFEKKNCIVNQILESRKIDDSDTPLTISNKLFPECPGKEPLKKITDEMIRDEFKNTRLGRLVIQALLLEMDKTDFINFFHQYLDIKGSNTLNDTKRDICWKHNIAADFHEYSYDLLVNNPSDEFPDHAQKIIAVLKVLTERIQRADTSFRDTAYEAGIKRVAELTERKNRGLSVLRAGGKKTRKVKNTHKVKKTRKVKKIGKSKK